MSGIPTSSGGDVKLDGNPNAFTGTNSFNINLPTSSLTTTTANDEFITKAIGDTIYGSGTGDAILSGGSAAVPQQFTGFNVFTNEIEQKDNSTDINSFRQTESSTAVGAGNFIEQDGVGKGHITQQADNSVIRQNGNDTQIIQGTATTTGAVFKQEGDDAEIKQEGIGVEFKQSSTFAAATPNIISTTGFVRAGQAPAIGDDCVNKTYFDANKGTGDALLAGGLTEAAPQEFTGFNNFTEDTHFDENIDADDTLTLNGSSAAFRIAGLSMTSGDTATLTGGNKLEQLVAGFYGNSIYQISGPVTPLAPAWYSCVFHQTGVNDIIRTEGKAQMATAPSVGDDLCNKTYVDAAAGGGGSTRAFQGQMASGSYLTGQVNPIVWNGTSIKEPSTIGWDGTTFTATADDAGLWIFFMNLVLEGQASADAAHLIIQSFAPADTIWRTELQSYTVILNYDTQNLNGIIQVVSGYKYRFRLAGTTVGGFSGENLRAGGFKIA